MSKLMREQIDISRRLLENPYAHLSDTGSFDAELNQLDSTHLQISASRQLYGNQYAHLIDSGDSDTSHTNSNALPVKHSPTPTVISKSRKNYSNQYAHLNGSGSFDYSPNVQMPAATQSNPPAPKISASRKKLGNPYAYLDGSGGFDTISEIVATEPPLAKFTSMAKVSGKIPKTRIEQLAHEIHVEIWNRRHQLWPDGVPADPVDLLDPSTALEAIGFDYALSDSLGYFPDRDTGTKVAGFIDQSQKNVRISRHLPMTLGALPRHMNWDTPFFTKMPSCTVIEPLMAPFSKQVEEEESNLKPISSRQST